MSRGPIRSGIAWRCFPRVSGDEPGEETTPPKKFAFSPRERG